MILDVHADFDRRQYAARGPAVPAADCHNLRSQRRSSMEHTRTLRIMGRLPAAPAADHCFSDLESFSRAASGSLRLKYWKSCAAECGRHAAPDFAANPPAAPSCRAYPGRRAVRLRLSSANIFPQPHRKPLRPRHFLRRKALRLPIAMIAAFIARACRLVCGSDRSGVSGRDGSRWALSLPSRRRSGA